VEALGLVDWTWVADAADLLRENRKLAARIRDQRRIAMARLHLAKVMLDKASALRRLALARKDLTAMPSPETYTLVKVDLWHGKKMIETGRMKAEAGTLLADATASATAGGWHLEQAQICGLSPTSQCRTVAARWPHRTAGCTDICGLRGSRRTLRRSSGDSRASVTASLLRSLVNASS